MAIAPHLYPNARYNALKDFKAISQILVVPHTITATSNGVIGNSWHGHRKNDAELTMLRTMRLIRVFE